MKDDAFALRYTGYRIISRPWTMVRDIMAEFERSEHILREALRVGHGIEIDDATAGIRRARHPACFEQEEAHEGGVVFT